MMFKMHRISSGQPRIRLIISTGISVPRTHLQPTTYSFHELLSLSTLPRNPQQGRQPPSSPSKTAGQRNNDLLVNRWIPQILYRQRMSDYYLTANVLEMFHTTYIWWRSGRVWRSLEAQDSVLSPRLQNAINLLNIVSVWEYEGLQ